jgi:hypothetical protein
MALKNPKHEEFARLVASNVSPATAYLSVYPKATPKSAAETGSRFSKDLKISSRISELKGIAERVEKKAQEKAIDKAAEKVVFTLLTMNDRRRIMSEIATTSIDEDTRMRAVMNDAKLAGELIDKSDLVSDGQPIATAAPSIVFAPPTAFSSRRGRN